VEEQREEDLSGGRRRWFKRRKKKGNNIFSMLVWFIKGNFVYSCHFVWVNSVMAQSTTDTSLITLHISKKMWLWPNFKWLTIKGKEWED